MEQSLQSGADHAQNSGDDSGLQEPPESLIALLHLGLSTPPGLFPPSAPPDSIVLAASPGSLCFWLRLGQISSCLHHGLPSHPLHSVSSPFRLHLAPPSLRLHIGPQSQRLHLSPLDALDPLLTLFTAAQPPGPSVLPVLAGFLSARRASLPSASSLSIVLLVSTAKPPPWLLPPSMPQWASVLAALWLPTYLFLAPLTIVATLISPSVISPGFLLFTCCSPPPQSPPSLLSCTVMVL
ncbi:hypothetical protein PO909_014528 [Leuciscus waleckii]